MMRSKIVGWLAESVVVGSSGGFLAWYVWAKFATLPWGSLQLLRAAIGRATLPTPSDLAPAGTTTQGDGMEAGAVYSMNWSGDRENGRSSGPARPLLGWDEQTYLPRGGSAYRGDQMALLAGLLHDRATDPALADLIADVEGSGVVALADSPEAANVREWRRAYDRATKLPRALVEDLARVTTRGPGGSGSRPAATTTSGRFRPDPRRHRRPQEARREPASPRAADPYDALLDEYEPGANGRDLAPPVRRRSAPTWCLLVAEVAGSARSPAKVAGDVPRRPPEGVRRGRGRGDWLRFRAGAARRCRPSRSAPGSARATAGSRPRYDPADFTDGFFSILHEVGHGLYEQGLRARPPGDADGRGGLARGPRVPVPPLGERRGPEPGVLVALAPARPLGLPRARCATSISTPSTPPSTASSPRLIRVQADEVTYNLHIS